MPAERFTGTKVSGFPEQGIVALLSMAARLLSRDDKLAFRVALAILDATIEDLEGAAPAPAKPKSIDGCARPFS